MANALDIIARAMRKCAVLADGETATGGQMQSGFDELNSMLMSWNTDRLNIFTVDIAAYPLVPGQQSYTIGIATPPAPPADFVAPRPQFIQNANIILSSTSPVTRLPLSLLNDDQWAAIKVQAVPNTIPQLLYNDGDYPLSTISLWGIPMGNLQLELYTWEGLPVFATPYDTVTLPPGYEDAMVYNLAVRLASEYGREVSQAVGTLAIKSLAALQSLNSPALVMEPDAAVTGSGVASDWNYMNGLWR